jgi:hypothetical protein
MSIFAGLSVICFAGSYTVALALETSRLWFRSTVRGVLLVAATVLGLAAHAGYLVHEATREVAITPLASWHHWFLVAAWVLAAFYLYLLLAHPKVPAGLFVLPLVLALTVAGWWQAGEDFPLARGTSAAGGWALVHSASPLLGTVAMLIGVTAGTMYLLQAWRLKHRRPVAERWRLPSLEWLERVNGRALVISAALLAVGVASGFVVNQLHHARQLFDAAVAWSDPVVWSGAVLIAWLAAMTVFGAVYPPARSGRKVAYLTLGSLVILVLVLLSLLVAPSSHAGAPSPMPADRHAAGVGA